eukprot:scaffold25628_cov33-Prasinocladus_malaysianus.AAC.1
MELYRTAKKRFDEEEDFKTRSREAVTALQSGDSDSIAVCPVEASSYHTRIGRFFASWPVLDW